MTYNHKILKSIKLFLVMFVGAYLLLGSADVGGPIADAGVDQNITEGESVTLDGSGSTPFDGLNIDIYEWSEGSNIYCENAKICQVDDLSVGIHEITLKVIQSDGLTATDTVQVEVKIQPTAYGDVSGTIRNALDGNGIGDVTLNIRAGSDARSGEILRVIHTDANGDYFIADLPEGTYTIEAIAEGYITSFFAIEAVADEVKSNQNYSLSPVLSAGETRIVLTWGVEPSDLDSHIVGPDGSGGRFHVYYVDKTSPDGNVTLDVDDTTSYGPETITITTQHPGKYVYYVYNYSRDSIDGLSKSNAKVDVYRGSNLIATYHVPDGNGYYWTVFSLIDDQITLINTIGDAPDL